VATRTDLCDVPNTVHHTTQHERRGMVRLVMCSRVVDARGWVWQISNVTFMGHVVL
jgi:hypothetical protein